MGYDARPEATRIFVAYSLKRLGVDHIDIYRPSRLDPTVPLKETVGAIARLVEEGWVRHIGLSEVGASTIRRAAATAPIADLQTEYSLLSRGPEDEILPTCRELGIGVTAYGVLSRGLISGHWLDKQARDPRDFRSISPRFQGSNLDHNLGLAAALGEVADSLGLSAARAAIAWVAAQGEDIVPLVGARRRDRLAEALGSIDRPLARHEAAALEAAAPRGAAAGSRYAEAMMAHLDSER